jgi:hypothetical protein
MSDAVLTTLIETLPGLLWVLFAVTALFVLRRPVVEQLRRLRAANTPFGTFDFEVTLNLVERAADSRKHATGGTGDADVPSRAALRAVVSRLEHAGGFLAGGRLLWVDDHPVNNAPLAEVFATAGMSVRAVRSTDDALAELARGQYDVVITDLARPEDPVAGFDLADRLAAQRDGLPVILFTFGFDPRRGVSPGLFAFTDAEDELIHLVIDVMERQRLGRLNWRGTVHRASALPRQAGPA